MHIPFLEARPPPTDAVSALSRLLEEEQERITRLWSKRLRAETYEVDIPGRGRKRLPCIRSARPGLGSKRVGTDYERPS